MEDFQDGICLVITLRLISQISLSSNPKIPEVKYLESYQAMFGGTPGTVHMTKEGVEFVYFNHGNKAFERVKISSTHAHMVVPIERKAHVPPQRSAP
jgi:hypothetical protein